MEANYKMIESMRFNVGERFSPWKLIVALYQNRDSYYYIAFDEDDKTQYIQSAIVCPTTANDLEAAIIETIQRPRGIEALSDVYARLQEGFYGQLFQIIDIPE